MHVGRRLLTAVSLAIALIVAGQGTVGRAQVRGFVGVSASEKLHCADHKDGVPPAERSHGADCALCQFCGALDALISQPLIAPSASIKTRAVFAGSPSLRSRLVARAQRARAPPTFS